MKNTVYIFGEMHTQEDRERVEEEIINLHKAGKIDYLLSEEIGPNRALTPQMCKQFIIAKDYSISDRTYKLGIKLKIPVIGIDNWSKEVSNKNLKDQNGKVINCIESFKLRESTMALTISDYSLFGNCAVIVGDSHLRGLDNDVMGEVSPIIQQFLNNPNVKIYRSPMGELKENNVVTVKGISFNGHAYKRLLDLAELLTEHENQYLSPDVIAKLKRVSPGPSLSDFIAPNKETFCYILDNVIVSTMCVKQVNAHLVLLSNGFTVEEHRGKGYMKAVFKEILKKYPKDKYSLGINVMVDNDRAIKLYEAVGFKQNHVTMILK